jgi:hypothetical protein
MTDMIFNPPHYECENLTITIEPLQLCEQCGFLLGNALKYLFRYQHKGKPLEDLKKAEFYLRRFLSNKAADSVDLSYFDEGSLIFNAFRQKPFFRHWSTSFPVEVNVEALLKWTQTKIREFENG